MAARGLGLKVLTAHCARGLRPLHGRGSMQNLKRRLEQSLRLDVAVDGLPPLPAPLRWEMRLEASCGCSLVRLELQE